MSKFHTKKKRKKKKEKKKWKKARPLKIWNTKPIGEAAILYLHWLKQFREEKKEKKESGRVSTHHCWDESWRK